MFWYRRHGVVAVERGREGWKAVLSAGNLICGQGVRAKKFGKPGVDNIQALVEEETAYESLG